MVRLWNLVQSRLLKDTGVVKAADAPSILQAAGAT